MRTHSPPRCCDITAVPIGDAIHHLHTSHFQFRKIYAETSHNCVLEPCCGGIRTRNILRSELTIRSIYNLNQSLLLAVSILSIAIMGNISSAILSDSRSGFTIWFCVSPKEIIVTGQGSHFSFYSTNAALETDVFCSLVVGGAVGYVWAWRQYIYPWACRVIKQLKFVGTPCNIRVYSSGYPSLIPKPAPPFPKRPPCPSS
jgi:hypothetical protein